MIIKTYIGKDKEFLIDEGDGHIVDRRIYESLRNGNAIFYDQDENGHAVPAFNKENRNA